MQISRRKNRNRLTAMYFLMQPFVFHYAVIFLYKIIDDSNEEFPKLYHNPIQYVTLKGILWIRGN